jgi:hypothetical protein
VQVEKQEQPPQAPQKPASSPQGLPQLELLRGR